MGAPAKDKIKSPSRRPAAQAAELLADGLLRNADPFGDLPLALALDAKPVDQPSPGTIHARPTPWIATRATE